jgi:hypothetical protein
METPPPTEISSRKFNPGENLPWTITLNHSACKIEMEKRKQDIKRILYNNSGKFPQCRISTILVKKGLGEGA